LKGKKSLGRTRDRWEDNISTDPREKVWEVVDWMHLAQDRDSRGDFREHGNEPMSFIKGGEFLH
jgi:hypothetical protein